MKFARVLAIIWFGLCCTDLILAFEASADSAVVRFWGAQNNRILRVALLEVDSSSGVVRTVQIYGSCQDANPSLDRLEAECVMTRSVNILQHDKDTLVYQVVEGASRGIMTFKCLGQVVEITSDFFDGSREIKFSGKGTSYIVTNAGRQVFSLETGPSRLVVNTAIGLTEFLYRDGETYESSWLVGGPNGLEAAVTTDGSGYYKIEMPSYGDPGEFSHRIEVWTDRPSRGTLRSAAINSYLLPAGTFDFIFPFFAPTPQEILEQAAAAQ